MKKYLKNLKTDVMTLNETKTKTKFKNKKKIRFF